MHAGRALRCLRPELLIISLFVPPKETWRLYSFAAVSARAQKETATVAIL